RSSSNRSLQFVSGDITSNSIPDGSLSDIHNNKMERENSIRNSPSSTRRLNIKQNPIKEIDEEITPATFPISSRQEDEKNERIREFREQYSLQQPNSNFNKRKRDESHYNVIFTSYIDLKSLLTCFINIS